MTTTTTAPSHDALSADSLLTENARLRAELEAARAVIASAKLACAKSLFPGRGTLMATIAAYEDLVKAK